MAEFGFSISRCYNFPICPCLYAEHRGRCQSFEIGNRSVCFIDSRLAAFNVPSSMIEIANISKTFNTGKPNQVNAISNVSLNIKAGEFLVIVGSNGSGKTTLLNLAAGNLL